MGWTGSLRLSYTCDTVHGQARTVVQHRHDGPLRVLSSLYPEALTVCHNVLVHPPGGLVGGDALHIELDLEAGAHALVTTPGATRCYRTLGAPALQRVHARLAPRARLEWLPLETIAYSGCVAESQVRFDLAPDAEMIGWDLLALGLPASDQPFARGRFTQRIELPDRWLEQGVIDAADTRLLDSPLGWGGRRVLGTLWFAAGTALADPRRNTLLDAARAAATDSPLRSQAGCTAVDPAVVVLRVLADRVEPAMALMAEVRRAWRQLAWQLPDVAPRVWRT